MTITAELSLDPEVLAGQGASYHRVRVYHPRESGREARLEAPSLTDDAPPPPVLPRTIEQPIAEQTDVYASDEGSFTELWEATATCDDAPQPARTDRLSFIQRSMITARLYNYFTDPEKGKRRQVAAGVLGLMALASGALITGEFLARDIGTRASSVLFKGLNLHQQLGDHHPFSEVLASSHHTLAVAPPHNIASQHQLAKTALARPLAPKPAANPNYSPLLSHHAVPKAAPQTEHLFQQPGPRHAFHEPKVPAIHLEHAHHPLNHAAGHKAIVKHEVTLQLNHRGDTIENEVRHYLQANHYSHDSSTVHRISSEILYRQHLSWHQATQLRLHYHIHIMREMLDQASKPRRLKTAA